MKKFEIFLFSFYNISQHKLRSILSITGVVIGSFIMSFFLTISDAFRYTMRTAEKMLGGDIITIDKYDWGERHISIDKINKVTSFPFVKIYSSVYENNFKIVYGKMELERINVIDCEPSYFFMHNYKIDKGDFLIIWTIICQEGSALLGVK